MNSKKSTVWKICVMAEYGSSGLWGFTDSPTGAFRHGMLECGDLGLPCSLCERLDRWIRQYEDLNPKDSLDSDAFNAEGMQLATLVKQHLGPERHVEYQGEDRDGNLLAAVVVVS